MLISFVSTYNNSRFNRESSIRALGKSVIVFPSYTVGILIGSPIPNPYFRIATTIASSTLLTKINISIFQRFTTIEGRYYLEKDFKSIIKKFGFSE